MKIKTLACVILLACTMSINLAAAEDNPEVLIKTVAEANQVQPEPNKSPEQHWQNFLTSKGWDAGLSEGGVLIINDRDLIISSATVFTKIRLGQPGWVESRVAAFDQAEMEAKTKIIRYLSETTESKRSLKMLESASWSDGDVDKVRELNEVADTIQRIGKKSMALAETKLDVVLQKLDPEYDPSKYEGKSQEDLKVLAEQQFNRHVRSIAMKTLVGVTPLYSAEGKSGTDEYQVLVGVIWSPKLNRLALSLFNDDYNIPAVTPGKTLAQQIPGDELALLGTVGTRIVIDDNGQYAVLAYGQAQPRRASPSRTQAALHDAKQIAANRARGQLALFIREGLSLREDEVSDEVSREFSDYTIGTEILREYQKKIAGKKTRVTMSGLRVLKEWSFEHPATGQQVAGAVVAWSPASANLSKQADETMRPKPKSEKKTEEAPSATISSETPPTPSMESMKVDTSAY